MDEDLLSRGGDREPSRWPRRLAVIGGALLVAVVGVVYFGFEHHRLTSAAAPSATASANASQPDGVGGTDLPWDSSLRLPVAGTQPAWFSPATGRYVPIGGLPRDSAGYQFTRAAGGWVVQASSGGELASGDPVVPSLPVWFLHDGAESATRLGTANQVTPAASVSAVWLTSYPATADPKASRTFDAVIAASPAEIAWMPECTGTCQVHVLDLTNLRQTAFELPPGGFAAGAAFSPSGDLLALQVMSDDGSEASAQLEVASVTSGRLTALPGTSVGGDTVVDFGWPTSGDSLVAEFTYPDTVQLAAWHPGATGLAVAVIRSGQDLASLVVG